MSHRLPRGVRGIACLIAPVLFVFGFAGEASAQLFQPPIPQLSLQREVLAVKSGDLDHDGKRDVLVVAGNDLYVMKNFGGGQFAAPIEIAAPTSDLAVADLNQDGYDDFVLHLDNNILVVFEAGIGTYKSVVPLKSVQGTTMSAIGDVDGDGDLDVVVYASAEGAVSTYLNQGNMVFQPGPVMGIAPPTALALADLNGDGRADLVTGQSGIVSINYASNSSDGFSFAVLESLPSAGSVDQIAVADLNGDGRQDVIAAAPPSGTSDGQVWVLLNRATGFDRPAALSTPSSNGTIVTGDFNDDQIVDLAYGCVGGQFSVLRGRGDGTFNVPAQYAVRAEPRTLATFDADGEGRLDLLAGSLAGIDVVLRAPSLAIDAGPDQHLVSGGGPVSVQLQATVLSGHSGVTFTWYQGTTVIGAGATLTTSVSLGTTTFAVFATAPDGATARDTVSVVTDLPFATQSSLDALHAKIDQLGTTVGAGLDAAVGTRASQASVDAISSGLQTLQGSLDGKLSSRASQVSVDTIGAILQTNLDAKISTRASAGDVQALATAVQNLQQSGVTTATLDALGASIAAVVNASRDTVLRANIEQALLLGVRTALYSAPASQGGLLDQVRAIVADVLAHAPASVDSQRAQRLLTEGNQAATAGDYRTAFYRYSDAYRLLVH